MRLLLALLVCAAAAPAASADIVVTAPEGRHVVVTGTDGADRIRTSLLDSDTLVVATEDGQTVRDEADGCEPAGATVTCELTGPNFIDMQFDVDGGGGNDRLADSAGWLAGGVSIKMRLNGDAGDDLLSGNHSSVLNGGEGTDRIEGAGGTGGPGDDTLVYAASAKSPRYGQEPGADTYVLTDSVIVQFDEGPVSVSFDGVADDGRAGEGDDYRGAVQFILGSPGADRFDLTGETTGFTRVDGREGDDQIRGHAGTDTLQGGPGSDRIDGAGGDDFLEVGEQDDVRGGAGRDELATAAPGDLSTRGFEVSLDGIPDDGPRGAPTSNVHADVEVVRGGNGPDRLLGASEAQELIGLGGDDVIDGAAGPDLLRGGDGADILRARDGGWDLVDCGDGSDSAADADLGDQIEGCELLVQPPVAVRDTQAPFLKVAALSRRGRRVRVRAYVDEPGVLRAEVRSGRRRVGRATLDVVGGTHRFTIRLRRGVRLARTLRVTLTATDPAGNSTKRTRRQKLKR